MEERAGEEGGDGEAETSMTRGEGGETPDPVGLARRANSLLIRMASDFTFAACARRAC